MMKEKKPLNERLDYSSEQIFSFHTQMQELISGVEQAENELDEIILKCMNEILHVIRELLSSNITSKEALKLKGFTEGIRRALEEEHLPGRNQIFLSIDQKLPDLKKLEEEEERIVEKTRKEMEEKIRDINRQIRVKMDKSTKNPEYTLLPQRVSEILEQYKGKVEPSKIVEYVNEIFEIALEYLTRVKKYEEISALETDFVIIYKTVQDLHLENDTVKRVLKIFTEIDCIKKKKKKTPGDPVEDDLKDLFKKYQIKKE